jgi:hypothetical protein
VCAVLETYRYNLYGTIVSAPLFYGVTIDLSLIFRLYIFVPKIPHNKAISERCTFLYLLVA